MKNYWLILIVLMAAVVQVMTTEISWAWKPIDKQQVVLITRPGLYPILGYRLESGHFAVSYSNWRRNVWENLNLNQYFFGGHPVERDVDFPKFPFWLLPLALIGVYRGIKEKWFGSLSIITLVFVILFGFIGNHCRYGPIVTYPFWLVSIFLGIKYAYKR